MKRLLILFLVSIIGLVGCGVKEDENGLKITPEDKREEVGIIEYNDRITNLQIKFNEEEDKFYKEFEDTLDRYDEHESKILEAKKTLVEGLSAFKPQNVDLMYIHNEIIDTYSQNYLSGIKLFEIRTELEKLHEYAEEKYGENKKDIDKKLIEKAEKLYEEEEKYENEYDREKFNSKLKDLSSKADLVLKKEGLNLNADSDYDYE